MAQALYDRVKVSTTTTGTGTVTLGSAVVGFRSFTTAAVVNGSTVDYAIEDGNSWEVGTGVYNSGTGTLTRTVIASSNANSALNLSGNAYVYITISARTLADYLAVSNIMTAAQYLNNTSGKVLTTDQVWSAGTPVNLGTPSGNFTLDFATFINGYLNPTGNFTLNAASNRKVGQSGQIRIWNPSSYTLSLNASIFVAHNGAGITLGVNRNILSYYIDDESLVHVFLSGKSMA